MLVDAFFSSQGACSMFNVPPFSGELRHGQVIFALDTQVFIKISNVYRNLNDQMKLDSCIREALSYTHVTIEITFVGMAIITTNIN